MKGLSSQLCKFVAALGCCAVLLGGCGKKSGDQPAAARGQVVARIGDQVVTTQEFENEMRLANVIPEVTTTSGDVEYAERSWRWRAVVSETGIENLYRVDVEISSADSNAIIRKVTGFIGEPVIPGQSNRAWSRGSQNLGVTQ